MSKKDAAPKAMEGLPEKKEQQMRRTIVLLTTMAMTLLVATSVALARDFNFVTCPYSGVCKGTNASDAMSGGGGDNSIWGYDGDDLITGGPGVISDTTTGKDMMFGGNGTDQMFGGPGDDTMYGQEGGDNELWGFDGDDDIFGGDGDDSMNGNAGDDLLNGGDGDDDIQGGLMNETGHDYDSLFGGWGSDGLDGGRYNDFYDGGPDSDRMIDSSKISNDTYLGLDTSGLGDVAGVNNSVFDQGGDGDILDLSNFDRSQVLISWVDNADADGNRDSLRVQEKGTQDAVLLRYYFDNKGGAGRGVGAIEKIRFKGGITVGFPAPQG